MHHAKELLEYIILMLYNEHKSDTPRQACIAQQDGSVLWIIGYMKSQSNKTNATHRTDPPVQSPLSCMSCPDHVLPPHGGYESLLSFQKARIVFDATARFCDRFIDRRSRTHDQMIQAARSGKQNILEGSRARALLEGLRRCGELQRYIGNWQGPTETWRTLIGFSAYHVR